MRLACAGLFLVTFVAYLPSLGNGYIWDDDAYVTNNEALRTTDGLRRIWIPGAVHQTQFYPLSVTSFWAEYHLWGLHALGYHLVNMLLHALNGVLLFLVLRRLKIPAAWFAAAVWALHPIQVESAGWITERKNVLSAAFYFAAALSYLQFASRRQWAWYCVALAMFVCALLSKTVTCSLPAALLLVYWWKGGRRGVIEHLRTLLPMLLIGAALAMLTIAVERHYIGAGGYEFDFTILDRCLIAGRAIVFYISKIVWPFNLSFIYPRWQIDAHAAWQYLFPILAIGIAVVLWIERRRFGVGPLVAYLIYVGTLFPALGFFNIYPMKYSLAADHFQYIAGAPLIALIVVAIKKAIDRFSAIETYLGGVALLLLATLTWRQQAIYENRETLWRDTVAKNPSGWLGHNNLGVLLFEKGKLDEAYGHYVEAVKLNPKDPSNHNNLGLALMKLGRPTEAIAEYEQAIRLQPIYESAHYNLAVALASQGKLDPAIAHYKEALRIQPNMVPAYTNLGVALAMQNKFAEAIAYFEQAAQRQPNEPENYRNLALAYVNVGRTDDAIAAVRKSLELRPNDTRYQQTLQSLLQIRQQQNPGATR